jgi:hypothetical protein
MSTEVSMGVTTKFHPEHLLDQAAMLAMRAIIALQPSADLGPGGRAAFDAVIERTPAADGVAYEAARVGGVPGCWCRPADASADAAILYLHGGAYVVGSAQAYQHFVGQIATRAKAAAFAVDYGLAPERPFPVKTKSCLTMRAATPIDSRSPVRQPSCTSGRAWCTSFPPTLPFCMPRAKRSTSPTTSCGATSPAEPPAPPIH